MFTITHTSGAMETGKLSALPQLVAELAAADIEHPDVAVAHETGWSLSLFDSGRLILEHVDGDVEPVRFFGSAEHQLVAATAVALGHLDELADWGWLPGYA